MKNIHAELTNKSEGDLEIIKLNKEPMNNIADMKLTAIKIDFSFSLSMFIFSPTLR